MADRFGKDAILYDHYHEPEFARIDLAFYLPELYHSSSDLIVLVLSKEYESKEWCGLEWNAVFDLIKQRKEQDVLLSRFDRATVRGIYSTAGFVELEEKTPEDFATAILERLAINENLPRTHYTRPESHSDWPTAPAPFSWNLANQRRAQDHFASFLTRGASHSVLLLTGPGDSGKSHLLREWLRYAEEVGSFKSALLDFKNLLNTAAEIPMFARDLGIELAETVTPINGLELTYSHLAKRAEPVILAFDSYERAGECGIWVERRLVHQAFRNRWLRVVISGQVGQETLSAISTHPQVSNLSPNFPTASDWFEYGRARGSSLTLEVMEQICAHIPSRCSIISQICTAQPR